MPGTGVRKNRKMGKNPHFGVIFWQNLALSLHFGKKSNIGSTIFQSNKHMFDDLGTKGTKGDKMGTNLSPFVPGPFSSMYPKETGDFRTSVLDAGDKQGTKWGQICPRFGKVGDPRFPRCNGKNEKFEKNFVPWKLSDNFVSPDIARKSILSPVSANTLYIYFLFFTKLI